MVDPLEVKVTALTWPPAPRTVARIKHADVEQIRITWGPVQGAVRPGDKPSPIPVGGIDQIFRHVVDQRTVRLQPGFNNESARGRQGPLLNHLVIAICSFT